MKTTQLQKVVNSPSVDITPRHIEVATMPVVDQLSFDEEKHSCKELDKVEKLIEEAAKADRKPLQDEVKRIIEAEKEHTAPLIEAINKGKANMLVYQNELARIEREANEKAAFEAAQRLLSGTPDQPIEQVPQLVLDKPTGLRTVKKARINSENGFVDWALVVETLILADKFDPDMLLKGLPAAMDKLNIREIKGIEVYEHTTQTLR